MKERYIQRAILAYLRAVLPRQTCGPWHTPNGGSRNLKEAVQLQADGTTPGVADLMWVLDGQTYAIEVKAEAGRLTKHQKAWRESFETAGGKFGVARSVEDARALLRGWGVVTRGARG